MIAHLIKRCTNALIILIIIFIMGFVWFALTTPIKVPAENIRTDVIVVLTGGSNRLETGIDLLKQNKATKLFISGVGKDVTLKELSKIIGSSPIDRSRIVLGYDATNTIENAIETATWMEEEQYTSLRLVTSSYHMKRSILEFQHTMPNIDMIPHPVSTKRVKYSQWWKFKGTTFLMLSEYIKYLFTFTRHTLEDI